MTTNGRYLDELSIGEFSTGEGNQDPAMRNKLAEQLCHQLINRLTTLLLYCTNLTTNVQGPAPAAHHKDLKSIEQSVQIIAELARTLVEYTRQQEPPERGLMHGYSAPGAKRCLRS